MRMAELSRESGVPTATIKYYLREGLLPAGERTGPNQARYDHGHLRRLRLIRALLGVAGLTITGVRDVVRAIDDPELTAFRVLGTAQRAAAPGVAAPGDADRAWAMGMLTEAAAARNWWLPEDGPVLDSLLATVLALRDAGQGAVLARIERYAEIAERLAAVDAACLAAAGSIEEQVELATAGTMLSDTLLAGLRRVAQKNVVRPADLEFDERP